MLRHNSELKQWYRVYSRKIEVHKSDESFAMTLKQVWRFLRDTRLIDAQSTLAQFNRCYNRGTKNSFNLIGTNEKARFDELYLQDAQNQAQQNTVRSEQQQRGISDDEDEDEVQQVNSSENIININDIHNPFMIILQRQFFDAVVRAAACKFASGKGSEDLTTLSQKLDYVFKNNLGPLAIKNKTKTPEDEKALKLANTIFTEYDEQLNQILCYFSGNENPVIGNVRDQTIKINQVIEMLRKANFLDSTLTDLKVQDIIFMIERYFDPDTTLRSKLDEDKFQVYINANPHLVPTIESLQVEPKDQEALSPPSSEKRAKEKHTDPKKKEKGGVSQPPSAQVTAREEDVEENKQNEIYVQSVEEKLEDEI